MRFINYFRLPAAFILCLNATPSLANKGALHGLQAHQIELLLIARGILVLPSTVQALVEYFTPTLNSRDTDLDDLAQQLNEDFLHNLEVLAVEDPIVPERENVDCSDSEGELDIVYKTTTTRRSHREVGDEKCVIS